MRHVERRGRDGGLSDDQMSLSVQIETCLLQRGGCSHQRALGVASVSPVLLPRCVKDEVVVMQLDHLQPPRQCLELPLPHILDGRVMLPRSRVQEAGTRQQRPQTKAPWRCHDISTAVPVERAKEGRKRAQALLGSPNTRQTRRLDHDFSLAKVSPAAMQVPG
jgi:hypothetical protein